MAEIVTSSVGASAISPGGLDNDTGVYGSADSALPPPSADTSHNAASTDQRSMPPPAEQQSKSSSSPLAFMTTYLRDFANDAWDGAGELASDAWQTPKSFIQEYALAERAGGALNVFGGAAEAAIGAVGIVTPEPGTTVAGAVLVVHGADIAASGLAQMWYGKPLETVTDQAITAGAEALGADEATAKSIGDSVDLGVSLIAVPVGVTQYIARASMVRVESVVANKKPVAIAGETESTSIGKQVHKTQADIRRESGQFSIVEQPITDKAGNPILVPKRVDLKTGEAQAGGKLQTAVPDAASFERRLIMDDKPLGRPIAKDRQEIIRFIEAYKQREGVLPDVIGIQRYDPKTGIPVRTDLHSPHDFLPK